LSAGAVRLVWRAGTGTDLPVHSGSQDAGSVWNRHDYSNGVPFAQIPALVMGQVHEASRHGPRRTDHPEWPEI